MPDEVDDVAEFYWWHLKTVPEFDYLTTVANDFVKMRVKISVANGKNDINGLFADAWYQFIRDTFKNTSIYGYDRKIKDTVYVLHDMVKSNLGKALSKI